MTFSSKVKGKWFTKGKWFDENGIVFEAEVSRDEVLETLELYKQTCPGGTNLNSLQGVLSSMEQSGHSTIVFLGRRSRTKSDLSMKMYEEEIQEWYEEFALESPAASPGPRDADELPCPSACLPECTV